MTGIAFPGLAMAGAARSGIARAGIGGSGLGFAGGRGGGVAPPGGSGFYFGSRYFGSQYFAPRYFSDGLGIANPSPLPVPSQLLMGSRFNLMGYATPPNSNGTNVDSNSRISFFNETGATVTKLKVYNSNWNIAIGTNIGETTGPNTIQIHQFLEYPAGTFTPILQGASSAISVAPGVNAEMDELTGLSIPAGAQAWIRSNVTVTSGQKWVQGYTINTSLGEAMDLDTGVDKSGSGTITNVAGVAFGPTAVKATGFIGTPKRIAIAGIGDSIILGGSLGRADAHGNIGFLGNACNGRAPYINMGLGGTTAKYNTGSQFAFRKDLLSKIGVTVAFVDYGINDLVLFADTPAQILANLQLIWNDIGAVGVKVVQSTVTPRTTSIDNWLTLAGQAPAATPTGRFTGGAASDAEQLAVLVRAKPSPLYDVCDLRAAGESSPLSGIWKTWESGNYTLPAPAIDLNIQAGATTTSVPTDLVGGALNRYIAGFLNFTTGVLSGIETGITANNPGSTFGMAAQASAPSAGDKVTAFRYTSRATLDGTHPTVDASFTGGSALLGDAAIVSISKW